MKHIGNQTIKLDTPPTILETASIVGPKEGEGPLAKYFDQCLEDEFWGEKTWEKAESKIIKETVNTVIHKSGIPMNQIDYCFAGDLLNQCISSSFGLRELNIPFFGVFGACSTFVESLCLGSIFLDGKAASNVLWKPKTSNFPMDSYRLWCCYFICYRKWSIYYLCYSWQNCGHGN